MIRLFVVFWTVISIGCSYAPSGNNYIETETEIEPITGVVTFDPDYTVNQILNVYGTFNISYNFNIGDKELYQFRIWLDNDSLNNINQGNFGDLNRSFSFNSFNYPDGSHSINFFLETNTGRNTLANQLRVEHLRYKLTIPVYFDNHAPASPITFDSFEKENGQLLLRWNAYKRVRFSNYYIIRQNPQNPNSALNYRSEPGLRNDTTFTDNSYIGGTAYYRMGVEDAEFGSAVFQDAVIYSDSYPTFFEPDTVNGEFLLRWSKCKYSENFNSYVIINLTNNDWWTITDINDTTLLAPLDQFDRPQVFLLRTTSKSTSSVGMMSDTLRIES